VAIAATTVGLLLLLSGPLLERRAPAIARVGLGWGLVLCAAATWASAPEASVDAFDAARGISGMLGWALFAFAAASPVGAPIPAKTGKAPPRRRPARADLPAILAAVALALALEVPGWHAAPRDRALLLRLTAIAGGLGLVATASAIVGAEAVRDRRASKALRVRDVAWVAAACMLVGAGVTYELWQKP
jgi:hypothetical protein